MESFLDNQYAPIEYPDSQEDYSYSPFQSPEDFSEQSFNAAQEGVVEDDESKATRGFHRNLALEMETNELVSLGAKLMEDVDDQIERRSEWENSIETAMNFLGLKVEEPNNDGDSSVQKSTVYDTTMCQALYRIYSIYKRELLPPDGPCKSQIIGVPTKELEEKAERRQMFANYALTIEDKGYYPDAQSCIFNTIFVGSAFKKVFQDPLTQKPRSRFIKAQDFIVDYNCTTLLSSSSLGFRYKLTKRELLQYMETGHFVKFTIATPSDSETRKSVIDQTALQNEGIAVDSMDNKSFYEIQERHVYLTRRDLNGIDELLKNDEELAPYIVTIVDRRAVEIKRNWQEDDELKNKEEHFVSYRFLEGFGLYGVGVAHLSGSNAITLTSVLRSLIEKAALNVFPGGLITTTARAEDMVVNPSKGEFKAIETGGQPIGDCFTQMPYPAPDPIFLQLYEKAQEQTFELLGLTETSIPENSNQTPVGTTLTAHEVANRLQSASLSSFHTSQRFEYELLFKWWAKCLPDMPYPFKVPGYDGAIMRSDFSDDINTVPVSDPNILTSTHRLLTAEGLTKLAASYPEVYNPKAIHKRMLNAMGIENPDEVLAEEPQPQALDAVSENMLLAQGQPIQVAQEQDHASHNTVHNMGLQQLQSDPNIAQANPTASYQLIMHMQKHSAAAFVAEIRQTLDPSFLHDKEVDEYLQDMLVQNHITQLNAQEAMQQIQQAQEQAQQQAEQAALPSKVMMEDIQSRERIAELEAQVKLLQIETQELMAKQKIEAEAFRDQLKFESDTAKIEADKQMAEDKNEVTLVTEQIKHNLPVEVTNA